MVNTSITGFENQMIRIHLTKKINVNITQTLGCPASTVSSVFVKSKVVGPGRFDCVHDVHVSRYVSLEFKYSYK